MVKPTPRAETLTANYGWTKPEVGASVDAWGGYINADLDGIDATVKGVSVVANAAYPASNPSGYQTAAQVASVVIGDNRIINGDMRIDQRNNGASGGAVPNGYWIDRWSYTSNVAGLINTGQNSGTQAFPYSLGHGVAKAHTPAAADYCFFYQPIEADMVSDFQWGGANAQPVTLSFWARCPQISGTFSGSVTNAAGTRCYPFTFALTANAWAKFVIVIPADTGGTWVMSGNAASVYLYFDLGCGSSNRGPANAWATTTGNGYIGATGAVNLVSTLGAQLFVTGVKLEIGSVATPFNRQSLAKSLADCQRYYQFLPSLLTHTAYGQGSVTYTQNNILPVQMRAAPTAAITNLVNVTNAASGAVGNLSSSRFISQAQVVATGQSYFYGDYALTAEL